MLGNIFGNEESKTKKKELPGKKAENIDKGTNGHISSAMKSEIAFLLDRSGSMSSYVKEAVDGFNDFVKSQGDVAGDAALTLCLFSDEISIEMSGVDMGDVKRLKKGSYLIGGSTALWDAIGMTMGEMMERHSREGHPARVIMVILTDGYENASSTYNAQILKDMVRRAKAIYKWEFIVIGVGVDAKNIADEIGIDEHCALPEHGTREGVRRAFAESARAVAHFRKTGDVKLLKA